MLQDFFSWLAQQPELVRRDWLILGKGPSLAQLTPGDLERHCTLGLNHVVRSHRVTVVHAIDIEVVRDCGREILDHAQVLVMPWMPHARYRPFSVRRRVAFRPSGLTLADYARSDPLLAQLAASGRLLWYNLATAPPEAVRAGSPVVQAVTFSASAALGLLAHGGVARVRSLGVDGGQAYSAAFRDLEQRTRLVAGQGSFDAQFREFGRTILATGVDFAPLHADSPIRVFVGAEAAQALPLRVLEHSIRRNCGMSVSVAPLHRAVADAGLEIPVPQRAEVRPRTPFSFHRFAIPQLCGRRGRAIYVDSDMLVFRDLRELWQWPLDGAEVLTCRARPGSRRPPQNSVLVLDCAALDWDVARLVGQLDAGRWTYAQFMHELAPAPRIARVLPHTWNDLERHQPGVTALTHFTDMEDQPWLTCESLLARLWCRALFDAVDAGFVTRAEVREQVAAGAVRPSLEDQLERGIVDPLLLPARARARDAAFVPPHRAGQGARPESLRRTVRRGGRQAVALARHAWHGTGAAGLARKLRNFVTLRF